MEQDPAVVPTYQGTPITQPTRDRVLGGDLGRMEGDENSLSTQDTKGAATGQEVNGGAAPYMAVWDGKRDRKRRGRESACEHAYELHQC